MQENLLHLVKIFFISIFVETNCYQYHIKNSLICLWPQRDPKTQRIGERKKRELLLYLEAEAAWRKQALMKLILRLSVN